MINTLPFDYESKTLISPDPIHTLNSGRNRHLFLLFSRLVDIPFTAELIMSLQ